ncbi:ribonuclease H-like domain-containing protein, partial [Flammula alnicola]
MMSVEYEPYLVQTHDVTREAKTGDQLLKHVLEDKKLMEEKFGTQLIGWCTDDGPDGKKMRRLLQGLFDWLIVILCWAHQINLVVGDFLVIRRAVTEDINHALEVIKWFNNHSTALALLQTEQILTFEGSFWALILPAITRWTAHYHAITRYLKLKQPLQICWTRNEDRLITCAGTKQELQEKARNICALVRDESLWHRLGKIQKILEPLAIAANVAQASHTRLDHVLLMLGNLVRIFSQNLEFDEDLRLGVLASLEKRWKKADQDVFITAVFLNPFIRGSLLNKASLTDIDLYAILERVYERVMRRKADLDFLAAFEDYRLKHAEFSDERMGLELMKSKFAAEDAPLDLRLIWSRLDKDVNHGRNAIVKLAIHIFS